MGIYTNTTEILGLRILTSRSKQNDDFHTEYEFTGPNWKDRARLVIPIYLGKPNIIFQILYPFSSSHDIDTGNINKSSVIWLNCSEFTLKSLFN